MQMMKLRQTWPFQALADETRFRIVRLLASAGVPLRAGQLASALNVAPNHLSRHLHILEAAGLTTTQRRGRAHYIGISASSRSNEPLCAAVLSMDDETGVFSEDTLRLAGSQGEEDDLLCYSGTGSASPSALLEPSCP